VALNRRTIMVGATTSVIWLGLEQPAGAQNRPLLPMRVVVYDYTDTVPATLQRAQEVVSRIFREIDVDTIWLDRARFSRDMPADHADRRAFVASVIYVSLLPPAMHKSLGRKSSVLGGAGSNTRRIWISLSRVDRMARLAKIATGDVLAQVLAHEIAHVLMPGDSHALTGLMQRALDPELIAHNRLSFRAHEAEQIRTGLAGLPQ
jgi:hypothetical protein